MVEYIERDVAAAFAYNCGAVYVSNRLSDKNAFPAADVAPVRRGQWITVGANCNTRISQCTNCCAKYDFRSKYCPNCGASMDGGINNGTLDR